MLITAVYGLYSGKVATGELRGSEHTPFWEEGGRGKYANKPILIIGGSSAVGQQGIFPFCGIIAAHQYSLARRL